MSPENSQPYRVSFQEGVGRCLVAARDVEGELNSDLFKYFL